MKAVGVKILKARLSEYLRMVKAGETGGSLEPTLRRLADFSEKELEVHKMAECVYQTHILKEQKRMDESLKELYDEYKNIRNTMNLYRETITTKYLQYENIVDVQGILKYDMRLLKDNDKNWYNTLKRDLDCYISKFLQMHRISKNTSDKNGILYEDMTYEQLESHSQEFCKCDPI